LQTLLKNEPPLKPTCENASAASSPPHPTDGSPDLQFETLLKQLTQLSPEKQNALLAVITSNKSSILDCPAEGVADWKNQMIARGLADGTIQFYTRTLETTRLCDFRKPPPTKVRNDQKALRSSFNLLEAEGLWLDNPTKGMLAVKESSE
jgi:hypothetical protein